jgi:hypothetical protein
MKIKDIFIITISFIVIILVVIFSTFKTGKLSKIKVDEIKVDEINPSKKLAGSGNNYHGNNCHGNNCHGDNYHKSCHQFRNKEKEERNQPIILSIENSSRNDDSSRRKILAEIFNFETSFPQIFGKNSNSCQLSNKQVFKFRQDTILGKYLEEEITLLFKKYTELIPGVQISPFNLFHCHFIFSPSSYGGSRNLPIINLLFHAFEYPNDSLANLGFCQIGSNISCKQGNYRKRNALYTFDLSTFNEGKEKREKREKSLKILDCQPSDIFCTRYAEEFGQEMGEIICLRSDDSLQLFFDSYSFF